VITHIASMTDGVHYGPMSKKDEQKTAILDFSGTGLTRSRDTVFYVFPSLKTWHDRRTSIASSRQRKRSYRMNDANGIQLEDIISSFAL
jgi:hypothetical protein